MFLASLKSEITNLMIMVWFTINIFLIKFNNQNFKIKFNNQIFNGEIFSF